MNFPKSIVIGSDHAGYEYKQILIHYMQQHDILITDVGTNSEQSCDYPDYAHAVAKTIENNIACYGILLCGSANGVAITANKHQAIRAALCWNKEIALLARLHNNANVLCIPARFTTIDEAEEIVYTFFTTEFEGGRHQKRVEKI